MKYFFLSLLLFPWCLGSQSLFTKVTDLTNPAVTFTNNPVTYKGVAWIDLDRDNWPDLFASQRFLFRNNRDGNFTRLTDVAGAAGGQGASGVSWGDLDNDGHVDCITASLLSGVHRNNGDNTFTPTTSALPNFTDYSAWDCALADADNNGRLDLTYVHANGFHATGPFPCRFYRQNTDGTFAQVTGYEFTDGLGAYTVPVWADYDLDGDMDLFIGSGPAFNPPGALPDYCYKNMLKETGSFSLQRLTTFPFMSPQDGQTYNFVDYDNDGDLDMCLTNYSQAPTRFYRNNKGVYQSIITPFTVTAGHLANCWGDVDNDGDLDVITTRDGSNSVNLYRNKGDTTFAAAAIAGIGDTSACGVAFADYDNDGDLDFYTNGHTKARALFRNDALAGNRTWAQFTLEGVQSNRSAIGATLRLKGNNGGKWQIRQVTAHNSFQSQNDLRQHFGLNLSTLIDSVEVLWPSGQTQVFANLGTNRFYKITEGQDIGIIISSVEPTDGIALHITPNPVSREFFIQTAAQISSIEMYDSIGKIVLLQTTSSNNEQRVVLPANTVPGTYYVKIRFEDGRSAVRQVVKM